MQGRLIFGTYRLKKVNELEQALTMAYELGIRHFDTAQLYGNEEVVGRCLQALGGGPDDPITITTKYWDSGLPTMDSIGAKIKGSIARLRGACDPSALKLRVLLHHPALPHVWRILEDVQASTPFLEIGVCNHNRHALETLLACQPRVIPCVNQVEVHPLLPAGELDDLIQCCAQSNVPVEAHSIMIRGLYPDLTPRQLFQFAVHAVGAHGRICVSSTNRAHLLELFDDEPAAAPVVTAPAGEIRLYPFQSALTNVTTFWNNVAALCDTVVADMAAFRDGSSSLSDLLYFLPPMRSKHSDLGRQVARHLYGAITVDDAACLAKFAALTKPVRRYLSDRVHQRAKEQKSAAKHSSSSVCCVRRRPSNTSAPATADDLSDAVIHPVPMPVTIPPRDFLAPFFSYLRSDGPWTGDKEFFRGALFGDGRMDLCKQVVGPTHIGELCQSLAGNSHVRHFLLGNNIAFDSNPQLAQTMASLMADNSLPIETWYLAGNCINADAIAILARALEKNTVARALWLKRNPIGPDAGPKSLSSLMSCNSTLTILDLDNCGLLDAGVTRLFLTENGGGVVRWPGIKHLYLDANGISDVVGADALAKFLAAHRDQLKSLYVSMNRLGDVGGKAVAAALTGSTTLKRFSLGSNRMTDSSASVIVDMALTCPRLVLVDVGCYKSTFDMGEKPNFFSQPEPWLTLIEQHKPLKHLDLLRNCMSLDDAHAIVAAAKKRGDLNVYASMNDVLRDKLSYVEGIPDKSVQKVLKHPKRVLHIDSIYRNRNN